jgi:hypothetical protein
MRITYPAVLSWLSLHNSELTTAQLKQLSSVVQAALDKAREREERTAEALRRMDEIARELGAASAAEVLRLANAKQRGTPVPVETAGRLPRSGIRKPYLNPFERDSTIYSAKSLKAADWFKRAQTEGWTAEQCHYKRLLVSWKSHGMKSLYDDPKQEYEKLLRQEEESGVVYSRTRRVKQV